MPVSVERAGEAVAPPDGPEPVIATEGLTRYFGRRAACERLTLSVPRGGAYGLLGRNGAGKSTFVRLLLGMIRPSAGWARIWGLPAGDPRARAWLGFLPENFRYPAWATGAEVVAYHARLAGVAPERRRARVAAVLDRVGLGRDAGLWVRGYSKGMQQRLGLAAAMVADPPLLILDEPTSALDPVGRREVRGLLEELVGRGTTVLLNSHLLTEVERVCAQVAVLHSGRVVAQGSVAELLRSALRVDAVLAAGDGAALAAVRALGRRVEVVATGGRVRVTVDVTAAEDAAQVAAAVVRAGGRLYGLGVRERSLEELFLELVGGEGAGSGSPGWEAGEGLGARAGDPGRGGVGRCGGAAGG